MILARLAAGLGLAALTLLQGCATGFAAAGAAVVLAGGALAVDPDYAPLPKDVTNQVTLFHPAPQVYATLLTTVERNGRVIVGTEPGDYVVRVSYPFSWTSNNWGGVLTLSCVPSDASTVLLVVGSGRDATSRLRRIGDEIIADLGDALAHARGAP